MALLKNKRSDEAVGWISTSDFLFLLVALSLALYAKKADEYEEYTKTRMTERREADRIREERDRLLEELKRKSEEFEAFKKAHKQCDFDLKNLDGRLEEARKEIERLRQLLGECNDHVTRKEHAQVLEALYRARQAGDKLERSLRIALEERDVARKKIVELEAELQRMSTVASEIDQLKSDIKALGSENDALRNDLKLLGIERDGLIAEVRRLRYEADLLRANEVGRYFVGLSKEDKKVLFVVDHSGSMAEPVVASSSSKGIQDRWQDVTSAIRAWLTKIPSIESAALILFSSRVRAYPRDYSLVKMDRTDGVAAERGSELTSELDKVEPKGGTNMVEAMELALSQYRDVDAIVLFTDGRPTGERESDNSSASTLCRKILDKLDQALSAGKVPRIYVVALGDYFDDEFGKFLVTLTTRTGGSFRGW